MKFVPKQVRQLIISCLVASFAVFPEDSYKETIEWIGESLAVCRCVQRRNFEGRLKKRNIARKTDWESSAALFWMGGMKVILIIARKK